MRLDWRDKLTYANAMSTIAVFIALGGTSYAVAHNSIGTPQLKNGAVTSAKVKDGSLQRRDLSSAAVSTGVRGPRGAVGPGGVPGTNGIAGANATIEAWRPLEYGIGWGPQASPDHPPAAYRKDSFGIVYLRGVAAMPNSVPSNGEVIATLPVGYRPQYRILVLAMTGSPTAVGRLNVLTNGQIVWVDGATGESDFTSLNGVTFSVDA
jgi:hypothetical protein